MKHVTKMLLIIASTVNIYAMENQKLIIRPAEEKDLAAINGLCSVTHHADGFKKGLDKVLMREMMLGTVTDDFVNKQVNQFVKMQQDKNAKCVLQKQKQPHDDHLLVAYIKEQNRSETFAGYCLFNKENEQQIQMSYFAVEQWYRNRGIGKQLALAAFATFNGIMTCKFRWLAEHTTMNTFLDKHCIEVNRVHLDYISGRIIEEVPQEELENAITFPILLREFIFGLKTLQ